MCGAFQPRIPHGGVSRLMPVRGRLAMTDETVFAEALSIASPAERARYLDRACAGNPTMRRDVEALLAAHAADNLLDRPPADLGRTGPYLPPADQASASPNVGDRIGHYRLMEQIGEGGF